MKRSAVVGLGIVLIVLASAVPGRAQGACTMQNLAGVYVFESTGSSALAVGPAPLANHVMAAYAPIAVFGRMKIGADGAADGIYWGVFGTANAGLDAVHWQGQVSDFADCAGVITYVVPVAGLTGMMATVVEHFAMVDGGKELRTVMKSFELQTSPPTQLPATWNTTARRVSNGQCGQPALRGAWVMTCQSMHSLTSGPYTAAAEAAMVTMDVQADGAFTGVFDTKIGPTPMRMDIFGTLKIEEGCTATGAMQIVGMPGVTITAKALLFGEGKEFLAIPVQTTTPAGANLNAYDNCRGIRTGR